MNRVLFERDTCHRTVSFNYTKKANIDIVHHPVGSSKKYNPVYISLNGYGVDIEYDMVGAQPSIVYYLDDKKYEACTSLNKYFNSFITISYGMIYFDINKVIQLIEHDEYYIIFDEDGMCLQYYGFN